MTAERKASRILGCIALFCLLTTIVYGAEKETTAIGRTFLKNGFTARPMGMGGAFTSLSESVDAAYYNPAGLGQIEKRELAIMHITWFENIRQELVGYIQPCGKWGVIGFSFAYLHLDDKVEREFGTEISRDSVYNSASILTYAYKLTKHLMLGASSKYMYQKFGKEENKGVGFDLGGLYAGESVRMGVSLQNLGDKVEFEKSGEVLPDTLRVGIGYSWKDLITAVDLKKIKDKEPQYNLGIEYWLGQRIALRTGGIFTQDSQDFTCGASLKLWDAQADYAYLPEEELDKHHRVSLTIRF